MANRACREVNGFSELIYRYRRNMSILGRSDRKEHPRLTTLELLK